MQGIGLGLIILGIVCLMYCISILLFMGYGTNFFVIWGAIGAVLIGLGGLFRRPGISGAIPVWMKITAGALAGAFLLLFIIVEGMILARFGAEPPAQADYCIVLGAQMKKNGPSDVLRRRLDKSIIYLEQNPDTKVIVSGGQGDNEHVTEAQGMRDYLTACGIDESRIIMEEESVNTYTNLSNSAELLDKTQNVVAVVTNNFHMFRALGIAEKIGYEKVYGLAADSYPWMVPNNLLREFFGVIKDFMAGNL